MEFINHIKIYSIHDIKINNSRITVLILKQYGRIFTCYTLCHNQRGLNTANQQLQLIDCAKTIIKVSLFFTFLENDEPNLTYVGDGF